MFLEQYTDSRKEEKASDYWEDLTDEYGKDMAGIRGAGSSGQDSSSSSDSPSEDENMELKA